MFISKKDVQKKVGVSAATIDRYEKEEAYAYLEFPKRIPLHHRVVWVEAEVDSFCLRMIDLHRPPK